jgi:hypothetical protein
MLAIDIWSLKKTKKIPDAVLTALAQEMETCHRSPRWHGLNTVRYGGRRLTPWDTALDLHLSKILIQPMALLFFHWANCGFYILQLSTAQRPPKFEIRNRFNPKR